jgi:uncharacterized membrane protein YedE/YeeE
MKIVVAFAAGLIFAVGLGVGGMTQPQKVLGFLDVLAHWDPSLLFVMGAAIAVHMPVSLWAKRQGMFLPALPCAAGDAGGATARPEARIDIKLIAGAATFGIGWGIAGYCPGPAIVSLATLAPSTLTFVGAMLGGMTLYRVLFPQV